MALSSSSADCSFAETYVRIALHELSALSSIYGRETAVQNALRVVERAWKTVPAAVRPPLSTFTAASFTYLWAETDERQNLPEGCVPLLCNPFVDYFDAPMYGDGIRSHYIVDGRVPTGYRAIPSVLFAPYIQTNPRRHLATRERINPIPIWFFNNTGRNDCFGVPVDGSCGGSIQLLCGDHKLEVLRHKTTLKLKFNWPNYTPAEKQIRGTDKSPMHSLDRLAVLSAGAVRNFMTDAQGHKISPAQYWSDIGSGPDGISIKDVLLLGVLFVSDGAAMPLLAARKEH